MAKKYYNVISPDGFPITCEPFTSRKAALKYTPQWIKRYEQQGYYSTASREKILLEDLPENLVLESFAA